MICLGLETSHKGFSLAITDYKSVLRYRSFHHKRMVDHAIIPAIDKLLTSVQLTIDDIDVVAIDQGPGSFTGLRVGLSTIKGLFFGRDVRVVAVPSLSVLAHNYAQNYDGDLCVIQDARRSLLYVGFFECENGLARVKGELKLMSIGSVLELTNLNTTFIGDGVSLYKKEIQKRSKKINCVEDSKYQLSHAKSLLRVAKQFIDQQDWTDLSTVSPMYLYPENCQIKKK